MYICRTFSAMNVIIDQIKLFLSLVRIKHWVKNLLIFAPLLFSGNLFNQQLLGKSGLVFFAFCFTAGIVYIINDWLDKEVDRAHPLKKMQRPIAAGTVGGRAAFLVCVFLFMAATICLVLLSSLAVALVIATYLLLNIAYTFYLKNIPWLDVFIIVLGFILRLYAGSFAINVPLSHWILSLLTLLALFLAFSKRQGELRIYLENGILLRKNIKSYNLKALNVILLILSAALVITYFFYSISPEMHLQNRYFYLSNLFVVAGIVRYDYILLVKKQIFDPTDFFWKDIYSQLCIVGWGVMCFYMIYL